MNEWMWNGARWWKFDFHTHTPASSDYGRGHQQQELRQQSPKDWLLDYMRAEVDCVAVTDHNSGEWIDRLKTAIEELKTDSPSDYRELFLFPGMEISVHGGVHLLAIFDPSKTSSDIDALRGAVGYQGTPGGSDGVTRKSFVDVVGEITSVGGISIPAHVDGENGLFQLPGTTLQQVLDCKDIFAMELNNLNAQKPQTYIDKHLNWTEVLGSDAHHPSGNLGQRYPGSHFTWIKMGCPDIEGLRLALLDGALSVVRSDRDTDNPNKHAALALNSIEVSQARYMGRSQSFTIKFNPWFNAIIGGRGTGKSTSVEFLRLALRRKDELPKALQPEFEQYEQIYRDREESGLLTPNASIKVTCRKEGEWFRIQWNPGGSLEPIERKIDGQWQPAEGEIQQRFPVRIYSQKQVFQLAKTPLALLNVIDEAPGVGYDSWSKKWKAERSRFLSLRARAREIEAGLGEESRLRGELDDVKRKLAVFEQAGHAEILKSFQKTIRQQRDVSAWEESWTGAGAHLRKMAAELVPDRMDGTYFDSESEPARDLLNYASKAHDQLDEIRRQLEALATQADRIVTEWQITKEQSDWKQSVDAALQAYEELQANLARQGAGNPAAYGEFVQRRQTIEQQLRELDDCKRQVGELNTQADACLQHLLTTRRALTASRRNFLRDVLRGNRYVRIRVVPYGARETVESQFRQLLQREEGGFEKDIGSPNGEGLLGELYRSENGVTDVEKNLSNIKDKIGKIVLKQFEMGALADKRFATHVGKLPPETIDRLYLWIPEDSLEVQYSATDDEQDFRPIETGSPGQKTAALLAFLLSYGEEPLILDQPEDDLDNHLIYDLIVTQLREVKRRRQVIVVTHNANIVVNGDAELVVALAARRGETQLECEGSLQEQPVRDTICEVMEGGREAFEDRYRRIALGARHV